MKKCQNLVKQLNKKMSWKEELEKIDRENCPQRQDSLTDQMHDLHQIANKFGFYDAVDYIRNTFMKNIL